MLTITVVWLREYRHLILGIILENWKLPRVGANVKIVMLTIVHVSDNKLRLFIPLSEHSNSHVILYSLLWYSWTRRSIYWMLVESMVGSLISSAATKLRKSCPKCFQLRWILQLFRTIHTHTAQAYLTNSVNRNCSKHRHFVDSNFIVLFVQLNQYIFNSSSKWSHLWETTSFWEFKFISCLIFFYS